MVSGTLNVVEEEAISIDNEIKTKNGQQTNEIAEIMNRLEILSSEVLGKGEQLQNVADQLEQKNSHVKDFEVKHEFELEKNGRCYAHNSTEARKLQKDHKEHLKEIKELEKHRRELQKELQVCQANLETVEKDFGNKRGLFQTRFCDVNHR